MESRAKSVWISLGLSAALSLLLVACGQPAPSAPTRTSLDQAIAPSPVIGRQSLGALTTTWNCFTGGGGIFTTAQCGGSVALGGQRLRATAAAGAPSTPTGLASGVSDTTVTLTWTFISGANPNATSFVIEAGSSSGQSDLISFDTGGTSTTLTVQQVPSGTYFVRVRAKNLSGTGDASNEIIVTVAGGPTACTTAPGAPTGLASTVSGSTVNLSWTAPVGGCAATGFVLEAGSASGLSNLASFNTGSTTALYAASGVAAGTYFVRVRAANSSGNSVASNEVIVTVGGSTPTGVTGRWIGLIANGEGAISVPNECGVEKWDWQLDLTQTGTAVTGTFTQTVVASGCNPAGRVQTAPVTGTVDSTTFTFTINAGRGIAVRATFTASRMTGTGGTGGDTTTFALTKQ